MGVCEREGEGEGVISYLYAAFDTNYLNICPALVLGHDRVGSFCAGAILIVLNHAEARRYLRGPERPLTSLFPLSAHTHTHTHTHTQIRTHRRT